MLPLKPDDGGNITIKTLGKENSDKKFIEEYEFKIKTLRNNFSLFMKGFCVPNNSDSINGQCIDVAVQEDSFLRDLELADDAGGSDEIDILNSADLYWLLVDGEVKKNDGSGLVAISSKFGWLVSGLVPRVGSEGGSTKSCLSTTHVPCLQNLSKAEVQLNEEVKTLWDLDCVGICDDEVSVYEKHASEIEFKKGRYEVGLPLKENYPAVEDNFDKCCNRLWKLKERLDKNPEYIK